MHFAKYDELARVATTADRFANEVGTLSTGLDNAAIAQTALDARTLATDLNNEFAAATRDPEPEPVDNAYDKKVKDDIAAAAAKA